MPDSSNRLLAFAVALGCVLPSLLSPTTVRAQDRVLTFEELYGPGGDRVNFYGNLPYINRWLKDGKRYLEFGYDNAAGAPALMAVDARTGESAPFYDAKKMETALAAVPGIGGNGAARLSRSFNLDLDESETEALIDSGRDLYVYNFKTNQAIRLTKTPDEDETNISFSPDGKHVAFVKKNNLYVVDLDAPGKERQLTKDGSPNILNGRLDWVYEEEVYGRGKTDGYSWSPDSKRLAFLRLDEAPIKPFSILDHLPRLQNTESERYPKAGDPNPVCTLGIATIDENAAPKFVDLSKYPEDDRLLVRYSWHPEGKRLLFQVQNRTAKFLDLNAADAASGKTSTLFRETTTAWVEIIENPLWLKDGSFLWQSDRTGYRHAYRYKDDGKLIGAVTKGDWDIKDLVGVDPLNEWIYFTANEHSAVAKHAYRARLDGESAPVRLTMAEGDHDVRFDPTFSFFLDTHADAFTPPDLRLRQADNGQEIRILGENEEVKRVLTRYKRSKPEFLQVKTKDGFAMEACIILPPDFDPSKKYPVFCPVYSGPGAQTVKDDWGGGGGMWNQFLAQHGIIVWMCDNRSASGKGAKSMWTSYKKFGPQELSDIEDGLTYLKTLPGVDASRIGISGWSFGGFMVEYALTHSKSFKMGVAGAGVSDWHLYDSIYTERYMDTPQANPEGYRDTAPVNAAKDCSGKLLLVHGMMDDNVHLQNTIQLVYGLQKAGKDFEMMLYPSPASRHGIGDSQLNRHLRTLEWKFIQDTLLAP